MTKIVFVISKMDIGGAEKVFHDVIVGLNKDGFNYDVSVVCLYEKGKIGNKLSCEGVELYECILKSKFDIFGLVKFIKILRSKRPDILYIAGQTLPQAVSFISSIFVKIPLRIIGVHSHDLAHRSLYKLFIDRVTFRTADRITCVSESQKRHIVASKRIDPAKISVIYNGVDVERFRANGKRSREQFLLPASAFIIGTIATLRPEKGLDVLLKAVPEVLKKSPKVYFLIVGDGNQKLYLEKMAEAMGIASSVKFLGEQEDIPAIINTLDIACSSSRIENFPLALLECMACEKPIVATKVGGVPEIIEEGITGLLVQKESPDELAKAILHLISNKEVSKLMGKMGRLKIEDNFRSDMMIDRYKKFFEEVKT